MINKGRFIPFAQHNKSKFSRVVCAGIKYLSVYVKSLVNN